MPNTRISTWRILDRAGLSCVNVGESSRHLPCTVVRLIGVGTGCDHHPLPPPSKPETAPGPGLHAYCGSVISISVAQFQRHRKRFTLHSSLFDFYTSYGSARCASMTGSTSLGYATVPHLTKFSHGKPVASCTGWLNSLAYKYGYSHLHVDASAKGSHV